MSSYLWKTIATTQTQCTHTQAYAGTLTHHESMDTNAHACKHTAKVETHTNTHTYTGTREHTYTAVASSHYCMPRPSLNLSK